MAILLILEVSCTTTHPVPAAPMSPLKEKPIPEKPLVPSLEGFIFPIDQGEVRVTKKTFGLKVSPKDSPITPEKFTGYHTGADFETFPSEKDTEVSIRTICTGPLVMKKWATGYGGVVVQTCQLDKEDVTVIYGHLNIASVATTINTQLKTGDIIGILGK